MMLRAPIRLALYQPDIPQNAGTLLRLGACLGVPIEIIGPSGFDLSEKSLRRAGLDYAERAALTQHLDYSAFRTTIGEDARLVLLTVRADVAFQEFQFQTGDVLMAGRESSGVPDDIHAAADARIGIPMAEGCRSLNVAVASAMVVSEALRQLDGFPG
ncbi:MAG: tRNA (cytidine(34)-2'-O)-methyltransferase [Pseudomonadota bacterium]